MSPATPSRILLTTDFSSSASHAYPYALALARHHDARLIALHVMTVFEEYKDVFALETYVDTLEQQARTHLTELDLGNIGAVDLKREIIASPSVASGVVSFAEANDIDMIIMSSHGRHLLAQLILGSVTRKVIATAPCPVLAVKQHESGMLEPRGGGVRVDRILVPTDLSDASFEALERAIEYATYWDSEIHLLSVVHCEVPCVYFKPPVMSVFDLDERMHARVVEQLEAFTDAVTSQGIQVKVAVQDGSPVKGIARYADSNQIDLIVMSRRGLGEAPHYLGGVTERLLHEAHRPILVANGNRRTNRP